MNMKITFYFDFKIFSFFHKTKIWCFMKEKEKKGFIVRLKYCHFKKKEIFKVKQIKF